MRRRADDLGELHATRLPSPGAAHAGVTRWAHGGWRARDDTGAIERVSAQSTGAPVEWEADVVLRDGTVAHVRPITPDDAEGIRHFHCRQSAESIYLRFFAPLRELSDRDIHRFTHVDHRDRVALVATLDGEIIGIGRYDRIDPGSAEVAFNISDHFQGKGIGSVMLEHLAAIAQELGINRFIAEVLPQNRKMLTVFKEAGYEVTHHIEDGVVEVSFDISPTERVKAVPALARAPCRGAQHAHDPLPRAGRRHRREPARGAPSAPS